MMMMDLLGSGERKSSERREQEKGEMRVPTETCSQPRICRQDAIFSDFFLWLFNSTLEYSDTLCLQSTSYGVLPPLYSNELLYVPHKILYLHVHIFIQIQAVNSMPNTQYLLYESLT